MNTMLSICIPTFNRIKYLTQSLNTLIPQARELQVPIYISDNFSIDNTEDVIHQLQETYSLLFYQKHDKNIGLDRNMLNVLSMSSAKYCWWLGDDDIIEDCSLNTVLSILNTDQTINFLLLNAVFISEDLTVKSSEKLFNIPINKTYTDCVQFFADYADKMPFGNLVVNREQLFSSVSYMRFIGTSHAYSGAVLDYLADNNNKFGKINIYITATPMVALRDCVKTWVSSTMEIYFLQIPECYRLLRINYQAVAEELLNDYLNSLVSYKRLFYFRSNKLLNRKNYKYLNKYLSAKYYLRLILFVHTPLFLFKLVKYLNRLWR